MWKRRLSFACIALLFFSPPLQAEESVQTWQNLDTPALLQEAASIIARLKALNEQLKKEADEAGQESRMFSERLKALNDERQSLLKELAGLRETLETLKIESEALDKQRTELAEALRISEASWKSYREEAEGKIARLKILGITLGTSTGILVVLVLSLFSMR